MASKNQDASKPLVSLEDIVTDFWSKYGRNYYTRYDYEGVTKERCVRVSAKFEINCRFSCLLLYESVRIYIP